jgi:hypothetical protein
MVNTVTPGVASLDIQTPVTSPRTSPAQANNFSGTIGTGGQITIGTYHAQWIPDPHRAFKFDVILPPIGGVSRPIVQSVIPTFDNTQQEPHPIGGRHLFIADYFDTSEITMVMYNDAISDSETGSQIVCTPLEYILAWKKLMRPYDNNTGYDDGTYTYPNTYWKDIYVYFQDMQNNRLYTLQYHNCFPTTTAPMHLDYENPGRSTVTQAFSVSRIKMIKSGSILAPGADQLVPGVSTLSSPVSSVQQLSI